MMRQRGRDFLLRRYRPVAKNPLLENRLCARSVRRYRGIAQGRQSHRVLLRPISRTLSRPHVEPNHSSWLCASCVPDFRFKHSKGGTQTHLDHE